MYTYTYTHVVRVRVGACGGKEGIVHLLELKQRSKQKFVVFKNMRIHPHVSR